MAFYSFVVFNASGDVVTIPESFLVLDTGQNVFNTQVADIEAFTRVLEARDVRVRRVNRLDEFERVEPAPAEESYWLPGTVSTLVEPVGELPEPSTRRP